MEEEREGRVTSSWCGALTYAARRGRVISIVRMRVIAVVDKAGGCRLVLESFHFLATSQRRSEELLLLGAFLAHLAVPPDVLLEFVHDAVTGGCTWVTSQVRGGSRGRHSAPGVTGTVTGAPSLHRGAPGRTV